MIIEIGTGFSIELDISNKWKLEYRGIHKGLPLYESIGGIVTAIAVVKNPAIGKGTKANSEEKTLTGPVMIPNLKMFRTQGPNGPEQCYWYFTADTINNLQQTFKGKAKIGH